MGLMIASNGVTGKNYKGNNLIALYCTAKKRGLTDPRWATFQQVNSKNWKIKPGANSVPLEKFAIWDKKTKKNFTMETVKDMDLQEKSEYFKKYVEVFINRFNVFNAKDIIGIPPLEAQAVGKRNIQIENIIRKSECPIHFGEMKAFYIPSKDEIYVPEGKDFARVCNFYSTVLHEMAHSTGHPSRLNRDLNGGFGSEAYAKEEIRAELGALFAQADAGERIAGSGIQQNTAAYLQSWVSVLKNDYQEFFRATADANKIVSYLTKTLQKQSDVATTEENEFSL